jgi:pyoverdine/dityrosine biosynthesis protein Dit1
MEVVLRDRRGSIPGCSPTEVCRDCIAPHAPKLEARVNQGLPMQFMMLAFPCKSPSPAKVLGEEPDMAERLCLRHINAWTRQIAEFYGPGAEIIIGADGRAFADFVEVSDATINAYVAGIRRIIEQENMSIRYVGIDDLLPELESKQDYDGLRAALSMDFEEGIAALHKLARADPNFAYQVNGVAKFLTQDLAYTCPGISRKQLQKRARANAYGIIQRGNVLRAMLEAHFPLAARLSVHPQTTHGGKLGVHIFPSRDAWMTPWHSVVLEGCDGSFSLAKRCDAEQLGACVVRDADGRPSHLRLSD